MEACGLSGLACLLRREGAVLHPEPLAGGGAPAGCEPLPLNLVVGAPEGETDSAVLCSGEAALARIRGVTGPQACAAIISPVGPPSPQGAHDWYLLAWILGSGLSAAPPRHGRLRAVARELVEKIARGSDRRGSPDDPALAESAFSGSGHGLLIVDEDGVLIRANASGSKACGPELCLRTGTRIGDLLAPPSAARLRCLMDAAAAGAFASEEIDLAALGSRGLVQSVTVDLLEREEGSRFLISLRDLAERDRQAEQLRREKEFSRQVLDAANACVLGLDPQGRVILFNEVFQGLTGRNLPEVLGRDALEILLEEVDRPRWRQAHLRAVSGESVTDQDFRVRLLTGGERTVCLSAGRITGSDGACRGVLWTGRDVTQERRKERQLQSREAMTSRSLRQLKEFSRISTEILLEKDLDTICRMFVNAISQVSTFRRAILTLCDDDFHGYQWYFAGVSDVEIARFHQNKMTNRERITIFQERFRLGNSYYIPHSEGWDYQGVRSQADPDEMVDWHPDDFLFIPLYGSNRRIVGIVSVDDPQDGRRPSAESVSPLELFSNQVAHSIEERKLDQEIRESNERYRTLVETMNDGVLTVAPHGRILFANAALSHLVGVPQPLLTGRPLGSLLEPEELAFFRQEVSLHEGGRPASFEVRLRAESGDPIPVQISATPYREDDVYKGCFAVVRDLRQQKKSEQERKATQEQLVQAEKLSALGELISGIAHELNNPLTGVMGYSELLLSPGAPPETKSNAEKIHREAVRCQKIVKNLLTFVRKGSPERKMIDVNALVEATLELRAYQLKVDNIEVVTDLAEDLPKTMGDFHKLQQVLVNIINNAHHAIMLSSGPGRIAVRTKLLDGMVQVSIADNGPGIMEEHLSKIFDPFFTTKEIGKGTGLGLSLSYEILKEHDGRIAVQSRPGAGATFTVALPVRGEEDMPQENEVKEPAPRHVESKNILVVDDEETILDLLESVLESSGHNVERASNGLQALQKIREADFDIIITDVKMPDMGGEKLYEQVSEIKPHLTHRMVFSTGDTVNPVTQALFKRTGNPYLAKPFRLEEVDQIILRVLDEGSAPS
jgi:PAS domain S-box-containing protein